MQVYISYCLPPQSADRALWSTCKITKTISVQLVPFSFMRQIHSRCSGTLESHLFSYVVISAFASGIILRTVATFTLLRKRLNVDVWDYQKSTVEPRFNEVTGDRPNLFLKSRVCYIENLDITNWRWKNQNVRYIEVIVNDWFQVVTQVTSVKIL